MNATDSTLPRKPCRTCKNRFHAACLYKVRFSRLCDVGFMRVLLNVRVVVQHEPFVELPALSLGDHGGQVKGCVSQQQQQKCAVGRSTQDKRKTVCETNCSSLTYN